jgi:hypothetical protein
LSDAETGARQAQVGVGRNGRARPVGQRRLERLDLKREPLSRPIRYSFR